MIIHFYFVQMPGELQVTEIVVRITKTPHTAAEAVQAGMEFVRGISSIAIDRIEVEREDTEEGL